VNRLASLAIDLVNPSPAKREQELAIERKTPFKRAHYEVQVVDPSHRVVLARRLAMAVGGRMRLGGEGVGSGLKLLRPRAANLAPAARARYPDRQ
jgi:hypothetical protein